LEKAYATGKLKRDKIEGGNGKGKGVTAHDVTEVVAIFKAFQLLYTEKTDASGRFDAMFIIFISQEDPL
jgi:hypothetical protein